MLAIEAGHTPSVWLQGAGHPSHVTAAAASFLVVINSTAIQECPAVPTYPFLKCRIVLPRSLEEALCSL